MTGRRRNDWVQFAALIVTLLGLALHVESRIARLEQHLADQDIANEQMMQRLSRIEMQR